MNLSVEKQRVLMYFDSRGNHKQWMADLVFGLYLSSHMKDPVVRDTVRGLCKSGYLRISGFSVFTRYYLTEKGKAAVAQIKNAKTGEHEQPAT